VIIGESGERRSALQHFRPGDGEEGMNKNRNPHMSRTKKGRITRLPEGGDKVALPEGKGNHVYSTRKGPRTSFNKARKRIKKKRGYYVISQPAQERIGGEDEEKDNLSWRRTEKKTCSSGIGQGKQEKRLRHEERKKGSRNDSSKKKEEPAELKGGIKSRLHPRVRRKKKGGEKEALSEPKSEENIRSPTKRGSKEKNDLPARKKGEGERGKGGEEIENLWNKGGMFFEV